MVWFGNLPAWLPYFLQTCAKCEGFDWQIFTDTRTPEVVPHNVKFIPLSKHEFEVIVSRCMESEFRYSHGYKLCDLKPAYGHFFEKWLHQYDYWGYGDLDVIMGNPISFLRQAKALDADVITANAKILVGHFTLLRNTSHLRLLYRDCPEWKDKFNDTNYIVFDEKDFSDLVKSQSSKGLLSLAIVPLVQEDCLIKWAGRPSFFIFWNNGRLFDLLILKEFGYFHFIQTKYKTAILKPVDHVIGSSFILTQTGFHSLNSTNDYLRNLIRFFYEVIRTVPWYLRQLLKRFLPSSIRRFLTCFLKKSS